MKSLTYIFLIIALFIIKNPITGQNVIIDGEAKGAEGKHIILTTYSDLITFTEKKLASAVIDSFGKFTLKTDIQNIILTSIKIDYYKTGLYIEPDKNYKIIITHVLSNPSDNNKNPYLNISGLSLELSDNSVSSGSGNYNDLNIIISKFDKFYDDFVLNNYETLFKSRHKALLDSFKIKADKEYQLSFLKPQSLALSYFTDYVRYKTGLLEFLCKFNNNEVIEKKYFYNNPVLYDNVEYMEFFNEIYSKYFSTSKHIKLADITNAVNENRGDYDNLLLSIKKDTLLKNGLSEMVLLKELNELYHTNGYNKENILSMITDATYKIKNERNKVIAQNLYKLLTKLKPGTKAPDFLLKDIYEKRVNLKECKGKYIYLNFWKSNIIPCQSELKIMMSLYEKYKDKIEFISICTDTDIKSMTSFLKDNKNYLWVFAYFNNDWDLLNNYDIRAYPTFVLIDDEGYILNYPAQKPSEQVQYLFDKEVPKQ